MPAEQSSPLSPDISVHRIGGGQAANLRLKPIEKTLTPPGISVLLGGTPGEAAEQMRPAFPDPVKFDKLHKLAETVGSTTVAAIGKAGFEVIADPSAKFPNHARLAHAEGVAGFSDANLAVLAEAFQNTATPRS